MDPVDDAMRKQAQDLGYDNGVEESLIMMDVIRFGRHGSGSDVLHRILVGGASQTPQTNILN